MASEKQIRMPEGWRAGISLGLMCVSMILADKFGIVDLIAKSYGYSIYIFLALIAFPVITHGLWLISRTAPSGEACTRLMRRN